MADARVRNINEAISGDVFKITTKTPLKYVTPWKHFVVICVGRNDAVVQRVDPVTDKTIRGFSTKNRLGLNPSNTKFIKTARNFEQRNRDFQDRYPFQPNTDVNTLLRQSPVNNLFQVPFNKEQISDYPNMDSYCKGQLRLDCLFHTLAALRLRSIDQCTKDARVCNALSTKGVKYTEVANYLSKMTGQSILLVRMTFDAGTRYLKEFLHDGYGAIISIEFLNKEIVGSYEIGEMAAHYVIAFKHGGTVDYYDPQNSYQYVQMDYKDIVNINVFVREGKDDSEKIPIPPMSVAEADSHLIPYIGGIAKYRTRSKTTRKGIKTTRKMKRMKRMKRRGTQHFAKKIK